MTETTTESPAILKREALRLAGLPVDGDWPESVTPGELAAMQYPCDHTTASEARKLSRRKQRDLAALAKAAIDAGELPTVPAVRQVSAMAKATEMRNSWIMGGPRSVTRLVRVSAGSREVQAIERGPCAAWLGAIGKPPGEYVRAWLGDKWQEEGAAQKAKTGRPPDLAKKEKAALAIVKAFEEIMGQFKGGRLPQSKDDFLDACRRLEKAKTGKASLFGTATADTVAGWIRPGGYRFASGKPTGKGNLYTSQLPAIAGKILAEVFDAVS